MLDFHFILFFHFLLFRRNILNEFSIATITLTNNHIFPFFRFFRQFLAFFGIHQMALALFRFIAAVGRTQVVANTLGTFTLLLVFVLGGFIVAKGKQTTLLLSHLVFKAKHHHIILLFFSTNQVENDLVKHSFHPSCCRRHYAMDDLGLLFLSYDVWTECHCHE